MAGRKSSEGLNDLTLLGNQNVQYAFSYAPEVLESVDNLHVDRDYFVKFNCPEFTSLCECIIYAVDCQRNQICEQHVAK